MKPAECPFEPEVLSAVVEARWPEQVGIEIRNHVEGCPVCADLVSVAGAIAANRAEMRAEAVIPDSGRVWWLAQMRARREAVKAAERPITAAQLVAFGCAVGLMGACFGAASAWFQSLLRAVGGWVVDFKMDALPTASWTGNGALIIALAAFVLVVPAAACLLVLRD